MATLDILALFILFSFFLPQAATQTTTCGGTTCSLGGPLVGFPFQLVTTQQDHHSSSCGYQGFDLSCKNTHNQNQTILTLPSFGDFTVESINYRDQVITIADPENCLLNRLLRHETSLPEGSPFSYFGFDNVNYTFLNCSPSQVATWPSRIIDCLSTKQHKVIFVQTSWLLPPDSISLPLCDAISTTVAPYSFDWENFASSVELTWEVPDCRSCEVRGQVCGLKKGEIQCSGPSNLDTSGKVTSGPSKAVKYGLIMGMGIPVILFFFWTVLYFCSRAMEDNARNNHQPITELSVVTTSVQQLPVVISTGLDGPTIESYPSTQLGESWELPKPNDSTCPICLSEYKSKEKLRAIPDCNHYFHADCVDEWLRINATCPVCRNPPQEK